MGTLKVQRATELAAPRGQAIFRECLSVIIDPCRKIGICVCFDMPGRYENKITWLSNDTAIGGINGKIDSEEQNFETRSDKNTQLVNVCLGREIRRATAHVVCVWRLVHADVVDQHIHGEHQISEVNLIKRKVV